MENACANQCGAGAGRMSAGCRKIICGMEKGVPDIQEIALREGRRKCCFHSILFETGADMSSLEGTVLWICKSPVRPGHKRKNWYVDVSIIPEREEVPSEADYRIEKFHSGGKGGQNVNKVETGVRVIHIPTGITVASTEERSQYMNKQKALKRLQGILTAMEQAAGDKQANQAWREHTRIVRGNPVRVYEGMDFRREAGHMRCADQRTKNAL